MPEFVRVTRNVNDTRIQVQKCFDLASYTANLIRESSNFELAYEPSCANVCFWYVLVLDVTNNHTLTNNNNNRYVPNELRKEYNGDSVRNSNSFREKLHKVAPSIKNEMQRQGDAMIGFQAVNNLPNFFRLVFPSGEETTEEDVRMMFSRMARIGEEQYRKHVVGK